MGKRELLIIAGFIVVGAIVYQFTAPPSTGTSSFSFGNFFQEARREMRGNPGRAELTHTATLPVAAGVRELRLLRVSRNVQVVGEARDTIEYTLTVSSNGPDDATAKTYAERTVFERDDVGDALVLRVDYPSEANQETSLVIKVPARLAVRVESAIGITIAGVAAAHVEGARAGNVAFTNIAGAVTGTHQDGEVTVTDAQSVKMRLLRLRSRFGAVPGGLLLDVRDGDCRIEGSAGPVEIDSTRGDITVVGHKGTVLVRGTDGSVNIDGPQDESKIDMRRTEVEVTLTGKAPVTIITTDQTARLVVKDSAAIMLDALSTEGRIQATDVNLTPETVDTDMKLVHTFGRAPQGRVTVRNTRGDIVIRK